ncbi:MAG: hypothetical protein GXP32_05980 [Kiritimatiellaeota bacterium]|nr:hypothetical protein [Kiritimatiellota bacterium]
MTILGKLEKSRAKRAMIRASAFAGVVLVLTFFTSLLNVHLCDAIEAFHLTSWIIITGTVFSFAIYLFFRYISSEKIAETAKLTDSEHNGKNRLEAAIELRDAVNPLKNTQLEETETFFKNRKIETPIWLVILMSLFIFIMLSLNSCFLYTQHRATRHAKELKSAAAAKRKKNVEKEKPPPDFAELALTAPESEMRAKPMDEIAWNGMGSSSRPIGKLELAIFVNGIHKTDIPVENDRVEKETPSESAAKDEPAKSESEKESNNIEFDGEFYLDELDVVPFDVVSYHLVGYADLNGVRNRKVISVPQFIEVRPFREDALLMKLKSMHMDAKRRMEILALLNLINKFLRFQITLNKAVFTVRTSGLDIENKTLKEQIRLLAEDQTSLENELDKMLRNTSPELISANMMDYLKQAHDEMVKAGKKLEELK